MPPLPLVGFFEAIRDQLPPKVKDLVDTASDLNKPVQSGRYEAFTADEDKLEVKDGEIEIFDQDFSVSGSLGADLLIHEPGAQVPILAFNDRKTGKPVFAGAETLVAPSSQVLSELRVVASAGIKGQLKPPLGGGLTLSANAAAGGGLTYRHLRPSRNGTKRITALKKLLETSRPPALVETDELVPGEVHVLETLLHLDFGLGFTAGGAFDLQQDLGEVFDVFDGMSAELKAHVEYAFSASLGFSLYEQMQLGYGRFNTAEKEWLRLRLQRQRRRELTFGAKLALQVDYDLAQQTLTSLFDRILALDPTAHLMGELAEIQELRKSGGWDAVKDRLVAKLGEEVDDFLETNVWRKWISAEDEAKINELLGKLQKIVEAYDGLDEKIRSLWSSLLASVDLGPTSPIIAALTRISEIDPEKAAEFLEGLLGEEERQIANLLETLSGDSLDELLVGRIDRIVAALTRAKKLATQALDFYNGLPDRAIGLIRRFAERTGIEGTINWLRANATSVDDLKAKADARIQKLVAKLVGKAFAKIQPDDLEKLGEFLDRMEKILKEKEKWEAKIRSILNRLQGELGFSLALEISRVTERAALLDIEFDPTNSNVTKPVRRALIRGKASDLLAELPEADTVQEAGYRIRDAVFTSRRVRTSALSVFFSLFGLRKSQTKRVDEETVQVTQDNGKLVREGTYAGGVVRTLSASADKAPARERELGVWLTVRAKGDGGKLSLRYQKGITERELRLTFARDDDRTDPEELAAIDSMLFELGFQLADSPRLADVSDEPVITRLAFDLRLGERGVSALFRPFVEAAWGDDYLNAAHRWYDEPLLPTPRLSGLRQGRVLAELIGHPAFLARWQQDLLGFVRSFPTSPITLRVDGEKISVRVTAKKQGTGERILMIDELAPLVSSRGPALKRFREAREVLTGIDAQKPQPTALRDLVASTSRALAGTAFGAGLLRNVPWPSPLFNLWLILARVGRLDPQALEEARGLAVARWKARPDDDWQGPLRWRLSGAPFHTGPDSIFPFPLAPAAEPLAAAMTGPVVASKSAKVFHSPDCPMAKRISAANRVEGPAALEGRSPHAGCA